jgi:hypothetical protein
VPQPQAAKPIGKDKEENRRERSSKLDKLARQGKWKKYREMKKSIGGEAVHKKMRQGRDAGRSGQ